MSTTEIMEQIERLPLSEQHEIFAKLARKVAAETATEPKPWLGKKLSFDEACDVVFRENRELLSLLAK